MQAGREIRFRGRRIDNGEWVYGWYHRLDHIDHRRKAFIIPSHASALYSYDVDPETVGQFTGIRDKNGKEIYERDIALIYGDRCVIEYDSKSASYVARTKIDSYWALDEETFRLGVEVIGNIYENPDLLEVGNNASRT